MEPACFLVICWYGMSVFMESIASEQNRTISFGSLLQPILLALFWHPSHVIFPQDSSLLSLKVSMRRENIILERMEM